MAMHLGSFLILNLISWPQNLVKFCDVWLSFGQYVHVHGDSFVIVLCAHTMNNVCQSWEIYYVRPDDDWIWRPVQFSGQSACIECIE